MILYIINKRLYERRRFLYLAIALGGGAGKSGKDPAGGAQTTRYLCSLDTYMIDNAE